MFTFDPEPILVDGYIIAERLLVGITIVVTPAKLGQFPRIFPSFPAVEIVAFSAGSERAIVAAEDIFPTSILTDLTMPWNFPRSLHPDEVVVIAVDLQSLLQFGQLLLTRTGIRRETSGDLARCTDLYTSSSPYLKLGLVIISACAILPFCSAAITEFCLTSTSVASSAAYI